MTEENRIEKNLETFNAQLKRTSDRLANRSGSAPPPDTDTSTSVTKTNTTPSVGNRRGRGKGKKTNAPSTRAATATAKSPATNADTTPDDLNTQTSNEGNPVTDQTEPSNSIAPGMGLISRDNVNDEVTRKLNLPKLPTSGDAAIAMPQRTV